MDAKLRYKAKKIKIVFFDIDDTLRNSKTGCGIQRQGLFQLQSPLFLNSCVKKEF